MLKCTVHSQWRDPLFTPELPLVFLLIILSTLLSNSSSQLPFSEGKMQILNHYFAHSSWVLPLALYHLSFTVGVLEECITSEASKVLDWVTTRMEWMHSVDCWEGCSCVGQRDRSWWQEGLTSIESYCFYFFILFFVFKQAGDFKSSVYQRRDSLGAPSYAAQVGDGA